MLLNEKTGLKQGKLTLKEAAEKAGVSYQTMRRWVQQGDVAGQKIGRTMYVDENALGSVVRPVVPDDVD